MSKFDQAGFLIFVIVFVSRDSELEPASVAQWAEAQCAPTGMVCRRGGVQSPRRPVDFVFGFQGACFEINFSGRQRGFDGVLYNL